MIWNTIAHPRMMIGSEPGGDEGGSVIGDTTETTIEGIKYADPHKLAFFDLLIDETVAENPKLIHGDFETVKKKLFNHELVVGGTVFYDDSVDLNEVGVEIDMGTRVAYNYTKDAIMLNPASGHFVYLLPDNTVQFGIGGNTGETGTIPNPGGGTVGPTPAV